MSGCENIDGQCGDSWCDCDYQRKKLRSFAAPACWTAPMLYEMGEVVKALDRLALVIPPEHAPLGHEAQMIRDAFASRKSAIEEIIKQSNNHSTQPCVLFSRTI